MGFDTTIDFDGLTFVFSGFAVERGFESLLAEFLANALKGMNIYAEIFGDTSILVVGTACVSLELDSGSSDGLGWVLASAGEAGQELALFVGESHKMSFHLVSVIQSALTNKKHVTIHSARSRSNRRLARPVSASKYARCSRRREATRTSA